MRAGGASEPAGCRAAGFLPSINTSHTLCTSWAHIDHVRNRDNLPDGVRED